MPIFEKLMYMHVYTYMYVWASKINLMGKSVKKCVNGVINCLKVLSVVIYIPNGVMVEYKGIVMLKMKGLKLSNAPMVYMQP